MTRLELTEVLLDSEVNTLRLQLLRFRKHVQEQVPDTLLFTPGGGPNLSNRYGAILVHVSSLLSILNTFGEDYHG